VIEEVPLTEGTVSVGSGTDGKGNSLGKLVRYRVDGRGGMLRLDREARSVACYDAMGVFVGWAKPEEAGRWRLPEVRGAIVVEVR
jgi:hypothetical protein